MAGVLLSFVGLTMVLSDSLVLDQSTDPEVDKYLRVEPWKRLVLGDGLAIISSFVSYYLDQKHEVPEIPRFTYLYIYNIFLVFNLIAFGYFFGGN